MNPNALLIEQVKPVVVQTPGLATGAGLYFSLKNYERVTFLIAATNGTTVTGSAISLKQATSVAAGNEKALSFSRMFANTDTSVNQQLTAQAVTNDTFTLNSTNSKNLLYAVEVDQGMLDAKNDFDCVKLVAGVSVAQTLTIIALLWPAKYGQGTGLPTALTD